LVGLRRVGNPVLPRYKITPGTGGPGAKVEVPLRDAKVEGGVVSFGVRREDGGVTRMEMKVLASGDAELKTLADSLDPEHAPEMRGDPALTLEKE
jgi:hypothetical protein